MERLKLKQQEMDGAAEAGNDSLRSRGNIVLLVIFLIRLCAINSLEKHPLSTRACNGSWEGLPFDWKRGVLFSNRKEKAELLEALVVRDEDATNITSYPQRIHLLWGDDDKIFNLDLVQNFKEQLGENATLHLVKDAGHLTQLERPFAYNTHLKRILSSIYNSE